MLYSRHLGLYKQHAILQLQLYEQHPPGFCALLAISSIMEQNLSRLFNWSEEFWIDGESLAITPIVHPRQLGWDHGPRLDIWLVQRVHPLLASTLAPRVPKICLETALSCLRYLQSGGHSVKSRKSLKPLLKSRYFMRFKMRPTLSRFRKRQHRHSSRRCFLDKQNLHSMWWGNRPERPFDLIDLTNKEGLLVSLCFFSYRSEYASNYDLWCTYRYALQLLPLVLANSPPEFYLTSIATNCIFSTFCTAYPQETRKAKRSISRYLHRCRPISVRAMPLGEIIAVDLLDGTGVD